MKPIGGYFELELTRGEEYHKHAIRLNTGRNSLEYILRVKEYRTVHIPYFICESLLEPLRKLSVKPKYYHIDKSFVPLVDFTKIDRSEAFLYINYFGLCNHIIKRFSKDINLIIDNSQSFFSAPYKNIDTFYSPRKFFGVPDGGYLYINKELNRGLKTDTSIDRLDHLIGRLENSPDKYFSDFKKNELALSDLPILKMSRITRSLLGNIDYKDILARRRRNFEFYHNQLSNFNILSLFTSGIDVPLCYPLLLNSSDIRNYLVKKKIYTPVYWPYVISNCSKESIEYQLAKNIIHLPVDQRYTSKHLDFVINKVTNYLEG